MNKYKIILADCPWDYFNPKSYRPSMGGGQNSKPDVYSAVTVTGETISAAEFAYNNAMQFFDDFKEINNG